MTSSADVLPDYEHWLHATANRIGRREDHDDLVQEGRIAMWRALETHDPTKGALPSWITRAAEQRMKDLAWGRGQPTGRPETRGNREVGLGPSLDGEADSVAEALLGYVEEAYHGGEIADVISRLSPKQREYVFLRFWVGLDPRTRDPEMMALVKQFPVLSERWHWQRAKETLRGLLAA